MNKKGLILANIKNITYFKEINNHINASVIFRINPII